VTTKEAPRQLLEIARTVRPNDTLLVWIDINATGRYHLPADPSLYGVRRIAITFSPDIEESRLLWCLAEVQAQHVESLLRIPWIFNVTLIKPGIYEPPPQNSKLSLGLELAIERASNCTLEVIVYPSDISQNAISNITTTIELLGGEILRLYENSLTAKIPARDIGTIVGNSFITSLSLNGPAVFMEDTCLETMLQISENINLFAPILYSLMIFVNFRTSRRRTKKKSLVLFIMSALMIQTLLSSLLPAVHALNVSTSTIRATDVWDTGNAGANVRVAVIDSGIYTGLGDDFVGAIAHTINIHDPIYGNMSDYNGHGTHVAGIIAGRGVGTNAYRGVAWEAELVIVKFEEAADLAPAVRWVINHRNEYNIRVISSSVGPANVPAGGNGLDSPYAIALDDAVEAGIVVVQAAGNEGDHGSGTIESPGAAFNVITVGAVNDYNTPDINDDELSYYATSYEYKGVSYDPWGSAKGPTGDGRPKPDVLAPGEHIWSTASVPLSHTYEDRAHAGLQLYGERSGTSMAAPHVAGTVALMLHANPNLTPAQVKAILKQTARLNDNLNELDRNDRGRGIIDAYAAVQLAQNVADINIHHMYDGFGVETPLRWYPWPEIMHRDRLTFSVSEPFYEWGTNVAGVWYDLWWLLGEVHYELLYSLNARHVWIDDTYYDLGTDMNRYLVSAPRIYETGAGYVMMRALYKVGDVFVEYRWKMGVDEMWLKLKFEGASSWRTLIYIDPDVWDTSNYARLPSTGGTIKWESTIYGDVLLDIRDEDPDHPEYIQIDPNSTDNPRMWILKCGYFGNDPGSAETDEYIYDRNIVVYYQATSEQCGPPDPGPTIYRKTNPPATPDNTQDDAGTGDDAGNNFTQATSINASYYSGILCYSDPEDTNDWYKFDVENDTSISVSLTPPSGIDFDLELYDPVGTLKAASYLGPGQKDEVSYTTDSSGYWRALMYIQSGEARYHFSVANQSGGGGGGGCPILYVYNGTEYVSEGLLDIHNPDGTDIVANHTLITTPKQLRTKYLVRLTEHPQTISHIDQVRLFAILQDKTMIKLPLVSAIHSEHGNVLMQLLLSDDWKTDTLGANWNNGTSQSIELKFLALPPGVRALGFVFEIEGNNPLFK